MTAEVAIQQTSSPRALHWVSLGARLVLGGAIMIAGLLKIGDLKQSVVAVRAYQLPLSSGVTSVIGHALPVVEILLGLVIVAGFLTRWVGLLGALLMGIYIGLIASVWARGLAIDCGCFSPGGLLLPGDKVKYLQDILRDVGLVILGIWLVVFPRSAFSIDAWIAGTIPEESYGYEETD